jgi:hypothetical protein
MVVAMNLFRFLSVGCLLLILNVSSLPAADQVRTQQLVGYGLVIGLKGKGKDSPIVRQIIQNIYSLRGNSQPPIAPTDAAMVQLDCKIPEKVGMSDKFDVRVTSIEGIYLTGGVLETESSLQDYNQKVVAKVSGEIKTDGLGAHPIYTIMRGAYLIPDLAPAYETKTFNETQDMANTGDVMAQLNLGLYYHLGLGAIQNDSEAVIWFRRASDQGFAAAQYELGTFIKSGRGVRQDYVEACKWLELAAAQVHAGGSEGAKEELFGLEKQMTSDQIAKAKQWAHEFNPHKFDGSE